jgi:hypothetical protein
MANGFGGVGFGQPEAAMIADIVRSKPKTKKKKSSPITGQQIAESVGSALQQTPPGQVLSLLFGGKPVRETATTATRKTGQVAKGAGKAIGTAAQKTAEEDTGLFGFMGNLISPAMRTGIESGEKKVGEQIGQQIATQKINNLAQAEQAAIMEAKQKAIAAGEGTPVGGDPLGGFFNAIGAGAKSVLPQRDGKVGLPGMEAQENLNFMGRFLQNLALGTDFGGNIVAGQKGLKDLRSVDYSQAALGYLANDQNFPGMSREMTEVLAGLRTKIDPLKITATDLQTFIEIAKDDTSFFERLGKSDIKLLRERFPEVMANFEQQFRGSLQKGAETVKSFTSLQEALDAGFGPGDRVTIGGKSGVLK